MVNLSVFQAKCLFKYRWNIRITSEKLTRRISLENNKHPLCALSYKGNLKNKFKSIQNIMKHNVFCCVSFSTDWKVVLNLPLKLIFRQKQDSLWQAIFRLYVSKHLIDTALWYWIGRKEMYYNAHPLTLNTL